MAESVLVGDYFINGNLRAVSQTMASGSVSNSQVAAGAGIATSKMDHRHQPNFHQPNTAATSETKAVYRCYGATGSVVAFHAGSIAANGGGATVTVDLKKNGVSILSAVITLNNANTNRVAVAGALSSTALVQGDLLEVTTVATVAGGTLATGVFAFVTVDETAV